MPFILTNICYLTIVNIRHSISYGLPTLLTFAFAIFYFQKQEEMNWWYMGVCIVFLLVLNTLFTYATCKQMMRTSEGSVNFLEAIIWRRQHSDFFVFVGLGMVVFVTLAIYSLEFASYFYDFSTQMNVEKSTTASGDADSFSANVYEVLGAGSRLLSYALLLLTFIVWGYICRLGIRIPAYVDGFYLRNEEALGLMKGSLVSTLAVSLFIIIGVTSFMHIITTEALATGREWLIILVWPLSYFVVIVMHIAMWVHLYNMVVKASGYRISRL